MEHFTRYYVRDADDETVEVYDGDDDKSLAFAAAAEIEGGSVWALTYVSDGQYQKVECEHDYDKVENGCRVCTACGHMQDIRRD